MQHKLTENELICQPLTNYTETDNSCHDIMQEDNCSIVLHPDLETN